MGYYILAPIFFSTLLILICLLIGWIFKPQIWRLNLKGIRIFSAFWFIPYFIFIAFFTGPENLSQYPPRGTSPYKLPWAAEVTRFVAQGNRSFTSHRGFHMYAWDFVMPIGTPVLAARAGKVVEVVENFDGIGINANFVKIEHEDGQVSTYAHIRNLGSLVKVGEIVRQGQSIALSGMVGQAPGPHLHFYVINKEGTSSVPISFSDVPGNGIPLAGHFYTSGNIAQ